MALPTNYAVTQEDVDAFVASYRAKGHAHGNGTADLIEALWLHYAPTTTTDDFKTKVRKAWRECPFDNMRAAHRILLSEEDVAHREEWLCAFYETIDVLLSAKD